MDNRTPAERHLNMSNIKSADTKPEIIVRKYLFARGLRYRKHVSTLPGKPDLVLRKYNTVIFINGCFWHHHDCRFFKWPKTNIEYWRTKIDRNVSRDASNKQELLDLGWHVLTVWECQLRQNECEKTLSALYDEIISNKP